MIIPDPTFPHLSTRDLQEHLGQLLETDIEDFDRLADVVDAAAELEQRVHRSYDLSIPLADLTDDELIAQAVLLVASDDDATVRILRQFAASLHDGGAT